MKLNFSVKIIILFFVVCIATISCGSSKPATSNTKSKVKNENLRSLDSDFNGKAGSVAKRILNDAEKYLGTPYKFAGNTAEGFDCSGLITKVFGENNLKLPRRSADQAEFGKKINIADTQPGDLLFFATAGGNKVSHVGIIHSIENNGEIKFLHASTSKGVIISSLNEKYWNKAFLHAQRVL
ncbi:NlpC/P60 family protein [Chryseobacterium piscicola]|uniref:Hydrolase Nlp/P60 n=1 Tax=Chryseobacterium piscicola TaxID=551459 RepID=A0A1N7LXE8_9FLAO|nr:C40 family peptidase [Chryseobacterium piscicola]PQA92540.1 hydrolase Nlp/P60 [Chryseobacterium piscicola]SIS78482.1 NlpC/P60 family protein [Chryseobacterium piscicola]